MTMHGATLIPATIGDTVVQQNVTPMGLTTIHRRRKQLSTGGAPSLAVLCGRYQLPVAFVLEDIRKIPRPVAIMFRTDMSKSGGARAPGPPCFLRLCDWCTTGTNSKWQYCHRDLKATYRSSLGKTCKSDSPCGYHNYAYAWCYTTDNSWDYCCTGDCASHGSSYDWCTSGTKWNYCKMETMPYPRHTYNLTPCRSDSTCGYHGNDYAWCYTDSSWDYCCTTECNMQEKNFDYDWCTTGISNKWQYCKRDKLPRPGVTAPNNACRSNHTCGYHGEAYAWCYTSSSWDYCCTGTCASYGAGYDWCTSGNKWSKCCCSLYD